MYKSTEAVLSKSSKIGGRIKKDRQESVRYSLACKVALPILSSFS